MFCKHCGCEITNDTKICPKCGIPTVAAKFCRHCGALIDMKYVVCPQCRKQVSELKQQQ